VRPNLPVDTVEHFRTRNGPAITNLGQALIKGGQRLWRRGVNERCFAHALGENDQRVELLFRERAGGISEEF
jgi:hypothetical protein